MQTTNCNTEVNKCLRASGLHILTFINYNLILNQKAVTNISFERLKETLMFIISALKLGVRVLVENVETGFESTSC